MHNKKIIRICAHTLPFAAKIKDVAPINAAVNVNISISPVIIFEITTISNDPSHKINLLYTNFYQITRIYTIKEDSHISILHTYHDNINKKRRISMDRCCCNQPSEIKIHGHRLGGIDSMPVAMQYVPWQHWNQIYSPEEGLKCGTIFPELNKPFYGKGACR